MASNRRGRVLRAQLGCNPNSSSLGVDVSFLLFGGAFASAFALIASALLRRSRPAAAGPQQGPASDARPPAVGPERAP